MIQDISQGFSNKEETNIHCVFSVIFDLIKDTKSNCKTVFLLKSSISTKTSYYFLNISIICTTLRVLSCLNVNHQAYKDFVLHKFEYRVGLVL